VQTCALPIYGGDVVVGGTEEPLATPVAAEQERADGIARVCVFAFAGQQRAQVFTGGGAVPDLELHGLPDPDVVGDRQAAGLLVDPDQVADQEVPALELALVLVNDDPQVQCALGLALLGGRKQGEDFAQAF